MTAKPDGHKQRILATPLVAPLIEGVKALKANPDMVAVQHEAPLGEKDAEITELRAVVADLASSVQRLEAVVAGTER